MSFHVASAQSHDPVKVEQELKDISKGLSALTDRLDVLETNLSEIKDILRQLVTFKAPSFWEILFGRHSVNQNKH